MSTFEKFVEEAEKAKFNMLDFLTESMSGEEVAKALGMSRQNVSQMLGRAIEKIYTGLRKTDPEATPAEIFVVMVQTLKAPPREIFKMLPTVAQKELEGEARDRNLLK